MKKVLLLMMMGLVSLTGFAQTDTIAVANDSATLMKFAYLSYDSVMAVMPGYTEMQKEMADLEKEYEKEMKRVEKEFNKQYEAFLDGQASFPKSILQKRQSELQEMLNKNIDFKKESLKLLKETEANMLADLKSNIDSVVSTLALEKGYAFVLNKDQSAVTFVNPANGVDITEDVKALITE